MKKTLLALALTCSLALAGTASAIMGGGMPGGGGGGMMGSGMAMTNTGGFGMMNGMAGAPVVSSDGTAFLVSHNPSAAPGPVPGSNSFQSTVTMVTPSGQISTLTLDGIVSRPVVGADLFAATASLPNDGNYDIVGNLGSGPGQSVLYAVPLPITDSSVPIAVTMDGQFASMPVIANNHVYVTTTDFGNAMMQGNTTFANMYGSFNFNSSGTARSFLYIINFDGSLAAKVQLQ